MSRGTPTEDDIEFQITDLVVGIAKEYSSHLWAFVFLSLSVSLSVSLASLVHLHLMPVEFIAGAYADMGTTLEAEIYEPGMYISIIVQSLGWLASLHSLVFNT